MRDGPNSAVAEMLDQNFYRKQGRSERADAGDLALVDVLRRDQFGLLIFVGQRFERELVAINRLLPALFDIANKFLSFPIRLGLSFAIASGDPPFPRFVCEIHARDPGIAFAIDIAVSVFHACPSPKPHPPLGSITWENRI